MVFENIFGKKKFKKAKKIAKKSAVAKKTKKQIQPSEDIDTGIWSIKAVSIIEILGAPEEHVKKTMDAYLERLKKEKDLKVKVKHISKVEPKDKFFSTYAEVELLAKKPSRLVDFCFDYMPSSIELIEPEHLNFDSHSFSNFFNDLQARLHYLDMMVKNLTAENMKLRENSEFIVRNTILVLLKEKDKDLETISKNIGIPKEATKNFLEKWVKQGFIFLKNGKYSLNRQKVRFSE